ncbi:putative ER lumen protein-retaining receptor C28H8.4 [Vitis vinifera]|uniref:Putative ER lumen protein-retaining receptor C28H8.4 n=2 Tax=Vitis vinifera TaxID=29760 RepID=A0A438FJJ1_VITVI|nr:putative ER lumen protein-retaining receptor C28H8.4 [Vitis vinifera]
MGRRRNSSVNVLFGWVRRQSMKVKAFLAVTSVLSSLLALKFLVKDRNHFFVASEAIHVVGIMVLIYKLTTQKTCSGNSFLFFWGVRVVKLKVLLFSSIATIVSTLQLTLRRLKDIINLSIDFHRSSVKAVCFSSSFIGFKLEDILGKLLFGLVCAWFKVVVSVANMVGLSLKTQELTAMFLAVRLYCSFVMEGDIHTVLDLATLISTLWVIYMIRFKLKSTYIKELDNFPIYYYVVLPSAILAILVHPYTQHSMISRICWAFCVYLESVSVLPQLRLMQNAKMVEPFTAHYVFALGVARFLGCAHWIIQVYEIGGKYLYLIGSGFLWLPMILLAEVVQTFILADFCYYYIKSVMDGQLVMTLSSPV